MNFLQVPIFSLVPQVDSKFVWLTIKGWLGPRSRTVHMEETNPARNPFKRGEKKKRPGQLGGRNPLKCPGGRVQRTRLQQGSHPRGPRVPGTPQGAGKRASAPPAGCARPRRDGFQAPSALASNAPKSKQKARPGRVGQGVGSRVSGLRGRPWHPALGPGGGSWAPRHFPGGGWLASSSRDPPPPTPPPAPPLPRRRPGPKPVTGSRRGEASQGGRLDARTPRGSCERSSRERWLGGAGTGRGQGDGGPFLQRAGHDVGLPDKGVSPPAPLQGGFPGGAGTVCHRSCAQGSAWSCKGDLSALAGLSGGGAGCALGPLRLPAPAPPPPSHTRLPGLLDSDPGAGARRPAPPRLPTYPAANHPILRRREGRGPIRGSRLLRPPPPLSASPSRPAPSREVALQLRCRKTCGGGCHLDTLVPRLRTPPLCPHPPAGAAEGHLHPHFAMALLAAVSDQLSPPP
ncbi:uncharacterized protein LOC103733020 [Nannospalax galili]|uniref:uncharacterized protein LOC103733020 n=1 Tax=Nannospalax galili TaxID=1026970 RepID=UPI0004ED00E6|nr:uncharacterized protein LOC103733020 [Nannospalax galili]